MPSHLLYDLFDPSAANVATMDEILSRVSANHRDVIPFLLMGTDARLRVLYDVVKVEDLLGPGRSSLANTYVGIEGDLDTLTHAPTFVAVPPAVCGRAPEVAAPTMAHLDAVLAGEANPAGYLHPAPAAVDADHTMVTTRFLQPTTWDVAALVLASPGMEPATAYQVLDGHLRALPDPDTHASTRAWLRACVCQSALNNAHSRVARAPPPVVRTDQGFEDQKLTLNFETRVSGADANGGYLSVQTEKFGTEQIIGPFDFVAGCGGVNSPVRDAIASAAPKNTFTAETRNLSGEFKVARLPSMPPLLDPKSVALILPSKPKKDKTKSKDDQTDTKGRGNTMSAFVEPVVDGGACILFAGRGGGDADEESAHEHRKQSILSDWRLESFDRSDIDSFAEDIISRFPLLDGTPKKDIQSMIQQLVSQRPGVAAAVKCNAFHYGKAALCGDAAHATGGVSGQGVNSALIDSVVLAECIDQQFANIGEDSDAQKALSAALLAYSQRQVPEGLALYDLSFGPEGELGLLGRLRVLLSTVRDTIFGGRLGIGRPLLQVQLSSSTRQFADIRRDRTEYYGEKFPDAETFNRTLENLYDV